MIHVRGTQDFLVTREFATDGDARAEAGAARRRSTPCAPPTRSIVTLEDNEIRRIASEIGLEHGDVVEIRQRYRDRLAVLKRGRTEGN